jgi:adenosine deaminase
LRRLTQQGEDLPVTVEQLERVVPVTAFEEWSRDYAPLFAACTQSRQQMMKIMAAHAESLAGQRVQYAELMVSGLLFPEGGETEMVGLFEQLRAAASAGGRNQCEVALLVAIGRGPLQRAERQVERILTLARRRLIVGVAIAGDERACTIESLSTLIARLRDAGLGIEIHAGEFSGPESVWDALQHGKPDRIGHGVHAFEDDRLLDEIRTRDVHLEFCPTSNLCLGAVPDIQSHPIVRARDLGLSYSVNTDDPGPFACTINSEFALLERELGFTHADFEQIFANAWRSRFTPN